MLINTFKAIILLGSSLVIYVPAERKVVEKSMQIELKELMLKELIDGEAIIGAAILNTDGEAITYHLPNTLTVRSFRSLRPFVASISHIGKVRDDLIGPCQYIVLKFMSFKLAFFEIPERGWLMIFMSPVYNVESVLMKVRQFTYKLSKILR